MVKTQGIVISQKEVPHAFFLYKIEDKTVKLDTLFTLTVGKGQEILIYGMNTLKKIADKLSLQAGKEEGEIPRTIVVNENNKAMLPYFLRAARLAKINVAIEKLDNTSTHEVLPEYQSVVPRRTF